MPPTNPSSGSAEAFDALQDAIRTADQERIRETLIKICNQFPEARTIAAKDLDTAPILKTSIDPENKDAINRQFQTILTSEPSGKAIPRNEKCKKCKQTYDTATNTDGTCFYPDGDKEVDEESSVWDDFDAPFKKEDLMDDPEFTEFADGFLWSCCEKPASANGYQVSRHEPAPLKNKKRRRS